VTADGYADAGHAALSYIMQRDPDIVGDAFLSIEPRLKPFAISYLATLVDERLKVLASVTRAGA
jgi:hypothetical protein